MNPSHLVTVQSARFSNSIKFAVINVCNDYEVIILCLKKIHEYYFRFSDSRHLEKRQAGFIYFSSWDTEMSGCWFLRTSEEKES